MEQAPHNFSLRDLTLSRQWQTPSARIAPGALLARSRPRILDRAITSSIPHGAFAMHGVAIRFGLTLALLGAPIAGALAVDDAKLLAYGKHLSAECSGCHRIDGVDNGIPSITGWPFDDFIATLGFFKDGKRQNAAMISVARSLDEEQVKALATYYGSLPKGRSRASPARK
jgi:cytochrome c553